MKGRALVVVVLLFIFLISCTPQQRAKNFGGTAVINLPPNDKLVVATWKEDHLWYLTRPMRKDEIPEKYVFQESSSWGMMQGKVIFNETR